jgi:DNA polymerase I-like protein with 3'-5' exonuclease and polymerase domains
MSEALVLDLETDGLLEETTTIHMVTLTDVRTGETWGYADNPEGLELSPPPTGTVREGLERAAQADFLFEHNGFRFDAPVIAKLHPDLDMSHPVLIDTMIWGATIRPNDRLKAWDMALVKQGKLPQKLVGSESLKAWGMRLGVYKGDYDGSWGRLTQAMWAYGLQDGEVTLALVRFCSQPKYRVPWLTLWMEQQVAEQVAGLEIHGVRFDVEGGWKLYGELKEKSHAAKKEMGDAFGSWYRSLGEVITTRKGRTGYVWDGEVYVPATVKEVADSDRGFVAYYTEGAPYTRVALHTFNPNSRDDISSRLIAKYGWEPTERTTTGKVKVDEGTLAGLPWPEAKAAETYLTLEKRLGLLTSWLKAVDEHGYIHGRVHTNRANTRRMTHSNPNLAQVPNVESLYGPEMRALFLPDPGWVMVGCDAQALEARCLASRMALYDGGVYAQLVVKYDVHRVNASYIENKSTDEITKEERNGAKTPFYALIYGAGDWKLGIQIGGKQQSRQKAARLGKTTREKFLTAIPALQKTINRARASIKRYGKLRALDGSVLWARAEHSALNLMLQSDGALIMKIALIFADQALRRAEIPYHLLLVVHDEFQITCHPDNAQLAGEIMAESIRLAGVFLGTQCPMDGEYKVGLNWAETH